APLFVLHQADGPRYGQRRSFAADGVLQQRHRLFGLADSDLAEPEMPICRVEGGAKFDKPLEHVDSFGMAPLCTQQISLAEDDPLITGLNRDSGSDQGIGAIEQFLIATVGTPNAEEPIKQRLGNT